MTPTEEQILRNQVAILAMLANPDNNTVLGNFALEHGVQCLKETRQLLTIECQQGRTVHAYSP